MTTATKTVTKPTGWTRDRPNRWRGVVNGVRKTVYLFAAKRLMSPVWRIVGDPAYYSTASAAKKAAQGGVL